MDFASNVKWFYKISVLKNPLTINRQIDVTVIFVVLLIIYPLWN